MRFIKLPKDFDSNIIQNNPLRQAAANVIESVKELTKLKNKRYFDVEDQITKILEDTLLYKED